MIIDMLNNGMDSLKRGFSSYLKYEEIVKEKETLTLEDYFVLKQAVLSTHHGVEILLKCILNKKSEFLIVDEIDSNYKEAYKEKNQNGYQSVFQTSKAQKIHTITYEEALSRVKYFGNNDLPEVLEKKLKELNTVRNALTHAEVVIKDTDVEKIFDKLLLDLDVLFLRAIGSEYSTFYGYSEIKANYENYMTFLSEHQMTIKKKALAALFSTQEKTEQYSGQNEVIYIEDSTVARKFLKSLQTELDFGMDLFNGWCSGKTKIKITEDGHVSFWAGDNKGDYIIKFKSMIICIPSITTNESPIIIFEADDDQVEPEYQDYVTHDYLEGLCIQSQPQVITYDPKEIYDFNMHCEYDEAFTIPPHYEIVRFLNRRIFGCFNIQGLSYWNFHKLLSKAKNMTGAQVAEQLKESLAKRS
ncbi:hypothetical protein [Gallintestinimicrobium sp.]|jgi:hypothetical protein|uniref:hypothetical protein n=1 Tax=Gallintestinimicrobium sp. TaxID=2981655 RepID=UPI003999B27C